MAENRNNIIIHYREDKLLFRITKIRSGNIIEVDELLEDRELAEELLYNLVINTESAHGFKAHYSRSPKLRILGNKGLVLVKFGNLGIEIGLSVKPIVNEFENMKKLYISSEKDHIIISEQQEKLPKEKLSFLDKLKSFIN